MGGISKPWLVAALVFSLFIWGNSLVPGEGSGSLSLFVVDVIRSALDAVGAPSAWVTNFLVRKTAHFTEYLVLGVLASRAFCVTRIAWRIDLLYLAVFLVMVPSIDETIQLFVPGRSGLVTDVAIDCCGALTGVLLSCAVSWIVDRVRAEA